jgi:L-ascorbate metabolism protein UlaG (beta-lactamase superfamily)
MELQAFGANCVKISTKKAALVIDDNLVELGAKQVIKTGDVSLLTASSTPDTRVQMSVYGPGEYEVNGFSIIGVQAVAHTDLDAAESATVYRVIIDELNVAVIGHISGDLSEDQLEKLGMVDVMIVPAGGHGYTLDAVAVKKLIKKIEPKMVVLTHFAKSGLNYPVPQAELEDILRELAMEAERTDKLKIKREELTDVTRLVVVES